MTIAPPPRRRRPASLMLALEPRLMFDAAAVATVEHTLDAHADTDTDTGPDAHAAAGTPAAVGTASGTAAAVGTATVTPAAPAPVAAPADTAAALLASADGAGSASAGTAPVRHELAFVDTALADWQTLAAGLRTGVDVIAIDGSRDGYAQMADALAGRRGLDAIHILSHGSAGQWRVGTTALDANTFAAHAAELRTIGAALAPDGDLLLYGCDIAAGSAGTDFIGRLATATGADVAASTDRSGAGASGGNWTLEAQAGAIETATATVDAALAGYRGSLATFTVTTTADSGAGSFRQAVADANANAAGGTDTIVFDASLNNQTITLGSVVSVTGSLIIDGDVDGDDTPDVILSGGGISGSRALEFVTTGSTGISLTVRSMEFANFASTAASAGSAIHFFTNNAAPTTRGTLTISDSIFHDNTHLSGLPINGGAVSVRGGSDFTIERSIFYSNTAGTNGGALYFNNGVIGTVRDSLFYDNQSNATTATTGGGAIGAFPQG